jgi:hypothetical protein
MHPASCLGLFVRCAAAEHEQSTQSLQSFRETPQQCAATEPPPSSVLKVLVNVRYSSTSVKVSPFLSGLTRAN